MDNREIEIRTLLRDYYEKIYKDALSLPDCQKRIESRLNEDKHFIGRINRFKKFIPFFQSDLQDKKVLILGAGTGGELKYFKEAGCDVYAIEPGDDACEILKKKAQYYNIRSENIIKISAESLPFMNNFFDFVWSWTVLEHVANYEKVLNEIQRVMKSDSWCFIEFPDYRQFYEGHYKMHLPLYLPKLLVKFILFIKRRPVEYFNHINMINGLKFINIIRNIGLIGYQIVFPANNKIKTSWGEKQVEKITVKKGIQLDQNWVLYKPE